MNPYKILLVEDDAEISEMLKNYLETENCEVACALDGQQACAMFDDAAYDLVLLDMMIPKVSGMPEVVKKWADTHNFEDVSRLQDNILEDYASDFAKHAPKADVPKLGWIWDSIPKQLAKDNNKFIFSHVKEGKRSSELEAGTVFGGVGPNVFD